MAKQRGPVASTFTGRVGNVVGAKMKGGEYVTRSYQPSVKNPNTLRQRVSRLRMATASQLAADFALAIQAGYAQASGSTHMFPRNMFVRELVRMGGMGAMTIENEAARIDYGELELSQRMGISSVPVVTAPSSEEPLTVSFTVTAPTVQDILPAGKMGLVVVVYNPQSHGCVVDMSEAPTTGTGTVSIVTPTDWSGLSVHVYAFYKWIPTSGNDVQTAVEPWKYPSETGECTYVGTVEVG